MFLLSCFNSTADLNPASQTIVKSVTMKNDGVENQQIQRIKNHQPFFSNPMN